MNTIIKITAASLIALGLAGAGLAIAQSSTETVTAISLDQAAAIALEAQPGVVEEIERDHEDGVQVFEVEVEAEDGEYEIVINATNGEVLSVESEDDDDWFSGKSED